jgi:assimilatory nitrate reductase catalytic subunit
VGLRPRGGHHVPAGAANKKAFGIDRCANPWDDILGAEAVWIAGSNTAECSPITTNYVWQAREAGGKVIVQDPRTTPIARTADIFLPVKPGRDVALFNGILHLMIENDWLDHDFIENHTSGFDAVAAHVRETVPPPFFLCVLCVSVVKERLVSPRSRFRHSLSG